MLRPGAAVAAVCPGVRPGGAIGAVRPGVRPGAAGGAVCPGGEVRQTPSRQLSCLSAPSALEGICVGPGWGGTFAPEHSIFIAAGLPLAACWPGGMSEPRLHLTVSEKTPSWEGWRLRTQTNSGPLSVGNTSCVSTRCHFALQRLRERSDPLTENPLDSFPGDFGGFYGR